MWNFRTSCFERNWSNSLKVPFSKAFSWYWDLSLANSTKQWLHSESGGEQWRLPSCYVVVSIFPWMYTSEGGSYQRGRLFLLPVMRTRGFSWGGEEKQVSWLFHLLICLGKQFNLCLGKFRTRLRQPRQNRPSTAAVGMQTGTPGFMSTGSPWKSQIKLKRGQTWCNKKSLSYELC